MGGLSVGVVGCGYWGSKHLRVLHSAAGVERVVAIDSREERLFELRETFPGLIGFPDLESALNELDAAVIATPAHTHVQLASLALDAGRHVLIEKPFATNTIDARRVVDLASTRGVTVMAGHTFCYNPAVWKIKELIEHGELGRIFYVDSARLNLGAYQPDVNVLWDLAPHDVSICNFVLGAEPTMVECWGSRHMHHLEDVAYMRLLYGTLGVTANIHVSWLDPRKVRRVTVVGSRKMAVYNDLAEDDRVRIYDKGVVANGHTPGERPMSYRYGEIRSPYIDALEPLQCQDQEFIDCVISGEQPRSDGENGVAVVEVLECAEMSLRERRPVALHEVSEADRQNGHPSILEPHPKVVVPFSRVAV